MLVADGNTYAAAGQRVVEAFHKAGHPLQDAFIFRALIWRNIGS